MTHLTSVLADRTGRPPPPKGRRTTMEVVTPAALIGTRAQQLTREIVCSTECRLLGKVLKAGPRPLI